jgi:hypothetical protein
MSEAHRKRQLKESPAFGTYDIETDPFSIGELPKAFAAGVLTPAGDYREFWGRNCTALAVAFMMAHPGRYYAHNGGRFDLDYVLKCGALEFEETDIVRIGGRCVKLTLGGLDLRDSFSLLPVSLAKLETGKKQIAIEKMHRTKRKKYKREILEYLRADCFSLAKALQGFFDRFGDSLTLAAAAWSVARHQFGIKTDSLSPEEDEELRRFYFGGRVQCFESGRIEGPLELFDINSAYPFAMLSGHFAGLGWRTEKRIPRTPGPWFVEFVGEATGLPWSDDGTLSFAGRRGTFFATGWEFHAARVKVEGEPLVYRPDETISFGPYIDHFFAEKAAAKERGDSTAELFAKLMLNALYGKYGQNPAKYVESILVPLEDACDVDEWEVVYENETAGYAIAERPIPFDKLRWSYKHVGVSASITGFVRAMLSREIDRCKRPVYCDTDSILCGKFRGETGKKLGQWKKEGDVDLAFVAGKKMYALHLADNPWTVKKKKADDVFVAGKGWTGRDGWKMATKGIGREMTVEDMIKISEGGTVEIARAAPTFSIKNEPRFIKRKVRKTA